MKNLFYLLIIGFIIFSCGTTKKVNTTNSDTNLEEAVVIKNDSLEYQIIIYDVGFSTYLNTIALPENYYEQSYYENKNIFYVTEWNIRASNPIRYGDFFTNRIDYNPMVDYGLEVNYKLYNYFKFVEYKYKIRLR